VRTHHDQLFPSIAPIYPHTQFSIRADPPVMRPSKPQKPKPRKCFSVGPTGIIAISNGRICTVYLDTRASFFPITTFIPFTSPITHLSWCKGTNHYGETPLDLLIADSEGHGIILNPVTGHQISSFSLVQGTVTAVEWDPRYSSRVYVAGSDGRLLLCDVSRPATELVWTKEFDFLIDFIRVSPFSPRVVVVASAGGTFSLFDGFAATYDRLGRSVGSEKLIDVSFHPFLNKAVMFVLEYQLALFFVDMKLAVPIRISSHTRDEYLGACFPDATREDAILLVYRSQAILYRLATKDAPFYIKYLHSCKGDPDQVRQFACVKGKFYVRGVDGTLQMFELRRNAFWAVRVARVMPGKPRDVVAVDSSVFFGCAHGVLARSGQAGDLNSPLLNSFWNLGKGRVSEIVAISEELVVVKITGDRFPVLVLINFTEKTARPFLRQLLEKSSAKSVSIHVSVSREFVAVLIDCAILGLCHIAHGQESTVKVEFFGSRGRTVGTFAENSREFWVVDRDFR
jgi:hypothetical protein